MFGTVSLYLIQQHVCHACIRNVKRLIYEARRLLHNHGTHYLMHFVNLNSALTVNKMKLRLPECVEKEMLFVNY